MSKHMFDQIVLRFPIFQVWDQLRASVRSTPEIRRRSPMRRSFFFFFK